MAQEDELGGAITSARLSIKLEGLPAQFRADGAAGAGDQHALAPNHAGYLVGLDLHRLAAQQVFEPDARVVLNLPRDFKV